MSKSNQSNSLSKGFKNFLTFSAIAACSYYAHKCSDKEGLFDTRNPYDKLMSSEQDRQSIDSLKASIIDYDIDIFTKTLDASFQKITSLKYPKDYFLNQNYCLMASLNSFRSAMEVSKADYMKDFVKGLTYIPERRCSGFVEHIQDKYPDCVSFNTIANAKSDICKGDIFILKTNGKDDSGGITDSNNHAFTITDGNTATESRNIQKVPYTAFNGNKKSYAGENWKGFKITTQKVMDKELDKQIHHILELEQLDTQEQKRDSVFNYLKKLAFRNNPAHKERTIAAAGKIDLPDITGYSSNEMNSYRIKKEKQRQALLAQNKKKKSNTKKPVNQTVKPNKQLANNKPNAKNTKVTTIPKKQITNKPSSKNTNKKTAYNNYNNTTIDFLTIYNSSSRG